MKSKSNRRASAIISLLIVCAIIGIVFWFMTKMNQKSAQDSQFMKDANVDTSSYKGMIDSARKVAEDASKEK